jgi:hypothetical protein
MRRPLTCTAALAVLVLASPVRATTLRALDLAGLTTSAERVFVGTVTTIQAGPDASGLAATWTTFRVDETLKGNLAPTLTIKQLDAAAETRPPGTVGPIFRVPGLPAYREGEKVLLFLNGDSPAGFTSPVGLAQGCFRISGDGATAQATNDVGNVNVTDVAPPVPAGAASRSSAPLGHAAAAPPRGLPLSELLGRVRAVTGADGR